MTESVSVHLAPWIMADTLEHMLATDMVIVMQLLAVKLQVPSAVTLADVLRWLETGSMAECSAELRGWWGAQNKLADNPLDQRNFDMTEVAACLYLSHDDLFTKGVTQGSAQLDLLTCQHVGARLFMQNAKALQDRCQIHASNSGDDIVQCMLYQIANRAMMWPSVFGNHKTLPHFWLGNEPRSLESRQNLVLTPVRVVVMEAKKAQIFVDARWLLLYCGLCGNQPSQSSRFLGISKWIEYFYHTCVPDRMVCDARLFTGLPSPVMDCGLLLVPHRPSGRETLRRPRGGQQVGLNAPIRTRAVEDMGPAALRYQMAEMLQVSERTLPTSAVSYSFPVNQWCPVLLPANGGFGSMKRDERGRFILKTPPAGNARVISARAAAPATFLSGRVNVDVRPLCMFDRPGVAVQTNAGGEWG